MKSNNLFDEVSEIFITEKDAEFFAVFVDDVFRKTLTSTFGFEEGEILTRKKDGTKYIVLKLSFAHDQYISYIVEEYSAENQLSRWATEGVELAEKWGEDVESLQKLIEAVWTLNNLTNRGD